MFFFQKTPKYTPFPPYKAKLNGRSINRDDNPINRSGKHL